MKAFIDTSTLCKRYIDEKGSEELEAFLGEVSAVVVSPVTWLELNSSIAKRVRNHSLASADAAKVLSKARNDFDYYHQIVWSADLENAAIQTVKGHSLSTLDAVQLGSGILSKADVFVTSDKKLFEEANKVIHKTKFI